LFVGSAARRRPHRAILGARSSRRLAPRRRARKKDAA
jgi:hypothetical protein